VNKPTNRVRPVHVAWGISLLFFLAGQAFITRVGVEADEALIFSPLLEPREAVYLRLFHHPFPVLLMSYLGTLKTLIYNPILHVFGNSLWALREPVLLAGAATIGLFFLILRRASGERAALIGCGILATDSMYLITNCYDWGPVALQHLLLLSGTLLALRFCEDKKLWPLAGAFFLWGLALWDKALSIWMLSSMGLAAVLIFPRYLVALTTRRRVAIALLAFILGGFPLLRFNLKTHWSTFRGNFTRDQHFYRKVPYFLNTLDGEGLFGWMMPFPKDQVPAPHVPDSHLTAVSAEISSLAGHPTQDWMIYATELALLLIPLARGRDLRTLLFCLVVLVGSWLQMALTAGAGGAVHHTVLLWPLPQAIVAVSLASASRRLGRAGKPVAALVAAALMISNALVLNEYYAVLWRSGAVRAWSPAILPLSDSLKRIPAGHVFAADWGILDPLRFLNFGKLPLYDATDPIDKPALEPADERRLAGMLDIPDSVYILHTKEAEQFPDIRDKLLRFAAEHGFDREVLAQISDGFGRQVFEVCRFSKAAAH
jgi:4-amino-4-deoxy-L-arabinose transferase-like glycosyltransferase